MVLRAAWMLDKYPQPDTYIASDINKTVAAAKLYAPEVAFTTVKKAMMWYGAAGYSKENDLEMAMRGLMSYLVGAEGAANIMRTILVRELLGPGFVAYR